MTSRYLAAFAALAVSLVLAACGNDTATTTSGRNPGSGMHGGGHGANSSPSATAAAHSEADIAFLAGMKPHHEQAVEMSDIVLAKSPPAPVAELARQIRAAQIPEIAQIETMLADLGQPVPDAGHGTAHGGAEQGGEHSGMMSEAEMTALRNASGADAARLFLTGMIKHHQGAIDAAQTELTKGKYEPARALAQTIAQDQAAEIATMEQLLQAL